MVVMEEEAKICEVDDISKYECLGLWRLPNVKPPNPSA